MLTRAMYMAVLGIALWGAPLANDFAQRPWGAGARPVVGDSEIVRSLDDIAAQAKHSVSLVIGFPSHSMASLACGEGAHSRHSRS